MKRELVVASDPAAAAAARFLQLRPATITLAGGSTPAPLYRYLARCTYPWSDTHVFFGDERCVPRDDPASNFAMANETLLAHVPARVHPMPGETCSAEAYEAELRQQFGDGIPAFDLVILGLGSDGHTASLFPGDAALQERARLVVAVDRPDHARLTLTLPVLSAAAHAFFLVTGGEKRDALAQLLDGGDIPAARVASARVTVFADEAAAKR